MLVRIDTIGPQKESAETLFIAVSLILKSVAIVEWTSYLETYKYKPCF